MDIKKRIEEMVIKMGKQDENILAMVWVGRDYSVLDVIEDLKEIKQELERRKD